MFKLSTLRRSLLALALGACASLASAAGTFHVELNTQNLANISTGWIDIQLGAAPMGTTPAWADLSHFSGFINTASAQLSDVTGSLSSGFRLDTSNTGWSDLFHEVSYTGGKIAFDLNIDGAAGSNYSSFSVSLYDANQQWLSGTAGADGFSVLHLDFVPPANAGESGSLLVSGYDSSLVQVTAVPEPESWLMLGAGVALLGLIRRRQLQA